MCCSIAGDIPGAIPYPPIPGIIIPAAIPAGIIVPHLPTPPINPPITPPITPPIIPRPGMCAAETEGNPESCPESRPPSCEWARGKYVGGLASGHGFDDSRLSLIPFIPFNP